MAPKELSLIALIITKNYQLEDYIHLIVGIVETLWLIPNSAPNSGGNREYQVSLGHER
jgi:hypothetical protein